MIKALSIRMASLERNDDDDDDLSIIYQHLIFVQ